MALILIEGFDHYTADDAPKKGWASPPSMGPGRHQFPPTQSVKCIINNGTSKTLPGSYSELILGFAFNVSTFPSSGHDTKIALFQGGPEVGITGGTGFIYIGDASGGNVATGSTQLVINTWYYCELHATNTHADLRLNGVSEIASTAGVYAAPWTRLGFEYQVLGGNGVLIDDVYVIDPTTGVNTTFLGDVLVRTLYPDNDATYTAFTPDPAAALHCLNVDERIFDGDTTIVYDGTPGAKDSYKIQLYGNDAVYGAQLNLGARAGDFVTRQIKPLIRQAGTDHLGSTSTLGLSYLFYSWLLDQDPTGSNWTVATVDADEFGVDVVA